MLYIVLFLLGCYFFHYINTKEKSEMNDSDVLLLNDQTASSSNAPETDVVI